jgi:hypothetical protein
MAFLCCEVYPNDSATLDRALSVDNKQLEYNFESARSQMKLSAVCLMDFNFVREKDSELAIILLTGSAIKFKGHS